MYQSGLGENSARRWISAKVVRMNSIEFHRAEAESDNGFAGFSGVSVAPMVDSNPIADFSFSMAEIHQRDTTNKQVGLFDSDCERC
ncbi:MAG: hypothetical protein P8011_19295 [Acidihalobacter sp.]